jgi:amidase
MASFSYGRAMNLQRQLRDEYNALLAEYDVVLMPTVPQPARRHVAFDAGPLAWSEAARMFRSHYFCISVDLRAISIAGSGSNTAASNMTGHPSITFPVGFVPPSPLDVLQPEDNNIKLPCGESHKSTFFEICIHHIKV